MVNIRKICYLLLAVILAALATIWVLQLKKPQLPTSDLIDLSNIESLSVDLTAFEGEIDIVSTTNKVLVTQFVYNSPLYMPEVLFSEEKGKGSYKLIQKHLQSVGSFPTENRFNKWLLRVNDQIPLDLTIRLERGVSSLKLSNLNLRSLTIDYNKVQFKIDLAAVYDKWKHEIPVEIHGIDGEMTFFISDNVGTKINVLDDESNIISSDLKKEEDGFSNYRYGDTPGSVNIKLWPKRTRLFFVRVNL